MSKKEAIFEALNQWGYNNLVEAVHSVKNAFKLSDREFYVIFMEWYNS